MDHQERWQAIAPASDEPGEQRSAPGSKKRRQAVAVACVQCRSGKAKCDGIRPRCTRCRDNDLACQYDVAEGVSRAERMKLLKRESMSSRVEELERVMNVLRSGSDIEASTLLARLRLGERVDDVARSLPPTAFMMPVSNPPRYAKGRFSIPSAWCTLTTQSFSLLAQDSTSTSTSGVSQESVYFTSDTSGTANLRHDSSASHASSLEQRTGWAPGPSSTAPYLRSAGKRKQSAAPSSESVDGRQFLSLLFDRQDFLLAVSESEDEDNADSEFDNMLDPRLLFEGGKKPAESPMDTSTSRLPTPDKGETIRSIHATHLRSRQPIVNTIQIHPNLNLRNLFGNLPFSSGVRANNYPEDVQDTQVNNLFLPTWAMMTVNTRPDPGSIKYAFPGILQEATAMLGSGTPLEYVLEQHPNITALFDEAEFHKSGILSKWAVGMVHSMMLKGNTFTCFAYMYVFWYLMRWMISPSRETYEMMPEWLRPTPNQLFMPHINMLDYIPWPAFRELAVQIPDMQEHMEWLLDMSNTLRCDWSFPDQEPLHKNNQTGSLDLCESGKKSMRDLSNWSVGPSFRGYVSNADSYVRIRVEEF
ncbi:bZIP transcription factor [Stagonosporopsis vannaccii]|nr:bZIP transcription factor [Stagonosporopsis vannaccii]